MPIRQKLLFGFLLFSIVAGAQPSTLPEFGNFTSDEMEMKECSFDKNADAVILLDEASSYYDDEYHLITDRRIRIKILKTTGLDWSTIHIHFVSYDDFEQIGNIQGVSYSPGGSSEMINIDKKSIFTERLSSYHSVKKFAMPGVKVGSILEYKYRSVMKSYGGLDSWEFQSRIPTIKSCYNLQMVPTAEFTYIFSKKDEYPAIVRPNKEDGGIYFEMDNIPGLSDEAYMDSPNDYLQKVEFQLTGVVNAFGDKKGMNDNWQQMAVGLYNDESLGVTMKKNLSVPADLSTLVKAQSSPKDKMSVIYDYVRDHFTWNGVNSIYAVDAIGKVWEKRTGTSGEMNLILVNLLQSFDIEASPMVVAERQYGKVNPLRPLMRRFDKTVAYVVIDGKSLILDATQKYCPASVTPSALLNTLGLVVSRKTTELTEIGSNDKAFQTHIVMTGRLDKEGALKGTCEITSSDYAKEDVTEAIMKDNKVSVIKQIEGAYEGMKVDSFAYTYDKKDDVPLLQDFEFSTQLNNNGGFILYNLNFLTGMDKNPFSSDRRFTDINFGSPVLMELEEEIELPAGAKTDDLLKDKIVQTSDKSIVLARQIRRDGNTLNIRIHFVQTLTVVPASSYDPLKQFYKMMVDILNEPVVIKMPG